MKLIERQQFTQTDDPPAPAEPEGHLRLCFKGDTEDGDHPIADLSAAAIVGNALFVAGDEAHAVERLTIDDDGQASDHRRFELRDYLDLVRGGEEMDIEGLAIDDGWLWITGSHSRTRPDPEDDADDDGHIDIKKVSDLKDTRPRCVLARIPLREDLDGLMKPVRNDDDRTAGLVRQKGEQGSKLRRLLCANPLLGPSCEMAAKEGGLDIEGLAAKGERVALGLRGPVIQTYAVLVEPLFKAKSSGRLHLEKPLRIRLMELGGLGVRDLLVGGDDLYILAGPTGDLDGRCVLYRWEGWGSNPPEHDRKLKVHKPERLFDIPVKVDHDHPEGIAWLPGEEEKRLLILYDSPAPERIDTKAGTILGDVFAI
ncbi:DUF3616 domain-containing protein [Sphingomicrobium flavum]|uniref:DUF3616 domain-containing protein n=1 Tax=Sphingomicrobium flavum TaxID=1229164 RepID=UPI0021AD6D95|nr:DUF3616 domain-containing protein [Sphingomicrobium flavum]